LTAVRFSPPSFSNIIERVYKTRQAIMQKMLQISGEATVLASVGIGMGKANVRTILIAEDQDDDREMMRIFLEGEGYNVVEAENGRDAIDVAQESEPDLILIDLNMPEMDGTSAVREIRRFESLRNVPVIANSASGTHAFARTLE